MYRANLWPSDRSSVLESISQHTFGCFPGDELDALHNAVNNDVLNAGVFSFCVFTDEHRVYVVVGRFVTLDGFAGADIGE